MKQRFIIFAAAFLLSALMIPANGQFKDPALSGGVSFGGTIGQTEMRDKDVRFIGRGFLRYGLMPMLQAEVGAGLGKLAGSFGAAEGGDGSEYEVQLIPVDFRFIFSPFTMDSWNPYLYAGIGGLNYNIMNASNYPTPAPKTKGWTGFIPAGFGMQFSLGERSSFDLSGGYNYAFSDEVNGVVGGNQKGEFFIGPNDAIWNFSLGFTVYGESGSGDPDGDGLTNDEEKALGTNPKVADTDGDGLNDGDEVNRHKTNPLKADSDGDGLKDGDEVLMYKTNPNKADSDGDGLSDGDEINKHNTNPLKADSDGDGLSDGDEVTRYKTNPLKADSDGDGLSDGDEVTRHKTDPLKADTDGGSVNDGAEVARGSNPLVASDDVPKKAVVPVEVAKSIVLEGITFKRGSANLTPESVTELDEVFTTLQENPEVVVEVRGYTSSTGTRAFNMKLSQQRAEAVKTWLVKKGIAKERIGTVGFGPDNPIAPNDTPEGREKNRRIEFYRVK